MQSGTAQQIVLKTGGDPFRTEPVRPTPRAAVEAVTFILSDTLYLPALFPFHLYCHLPLDKYSELELLCILDLFRARQHAALPLSASQFSSILTEFSLLAG